MAVQVDIANAEAQRLREAVKKIRLSKKDLRHLGKGNFAGVMTGKGILDEMEERDKKDREKAAKKAVKATRSKKLAPGLHLSCLFLFEFTQALESAFSLRIPQQGYCA